MTGSNGRGHDRQAELGQHRVGRGIGLLRGEASVLDREVRHVAGGVDVRHALDAGVLVDRDEVLLVARDAFDATAEDARQRDHVLGAPARRPSLSSIRAVARPPRRGRR